MPHIFAYGSLLNKNTWSFEAEMELVSLGGWVREWRQIVSLERGDICALTISPHSSHSIEGIVLKVDNSALEVLGDREVSYDKTLLENNNLNSFNTKKSFINQSTFTYTASKKTGVWANQEAPILLSYIDVVAKGYHDLFGWQGVLDFFKSTQGWNLPILNDREDPIYPRATKHDKGFLDLIDQQIIIHSKLQNDEKER